MKTLAQCFLQLARNGKTLDNTANALFDPLKAKKIKTLAQFDVEVAEGCKANNWTRSKGRPAKGSKMKPVPDIIQVYVSRFRAAYRLELDVLSFKTVGEMRAAVLKHRQDARAATDGRPPELAGIQLSSENKLIGALFHDIPELWKHLPEERQALFYKQIDRVYRTYLKDAPPELIQAAA